MQIAGKVIQVAGPAVDVQFEGGNLPKIFNAVKVTSKGFDVPQPIEVTCEVQQYLGEGRVRTVAMQPTEGMVRGMPVEDTGKAISVPVGPASSGAGAQRTGGTGRRTRPGRDRD